MKWRIQILKIKTQLIYATIMDYPDSELVSHYIFASTMTSVSDAGKLT